MWCRGAALKLIDEHRRIEPRQAIKLYPCDASRWQVVDRLQISALILGPENGFDLLISTSTIVYGILSRAPSIVRDAIADAVPVPLSAFSVIHGMASSDLLPKLSFHLVLHVPIHVAPSNARSHEPTAI
jgi:hypothetical protein